LNAFSDKFCDLKAGDNVTIVNSALMKATPQPSCADVLSDTLKVERIDFQERLGCIDGVRGVCETEATSSGTDCVRGEGRGVGRDERDILDVISSMVVSVVLIMVRNT